MLNASVGEELSSSAKSLWLDERIRTLPPGPRRKIHLDFDNGANVRDVGRDFDPHEFVATLTAAHVDAIVVFAKCVHGYCYYPSALGPVHPALVEPDLLGKQVAACRAAGIEVHAYYPYAWDELLAERHPEWLLVKPDGTTYRPPPGEQASWSALCISHPGLLDVVLAHVSEVLEHCPVDGMWFDEVFSLGGACHCARCLSALEEAGLDAHDPAVQRRRHHELVGSVQRRLVEHVRGIRADAQVAFNTQAVLGLRERLDCVQGIDIEALPTGGWGYGYFPIHARYARTFGVPVYGMTGKFAKAWGEYGGLKHPTQLRTELAGIVALGARCDVGDEPGPGARLDPAVYATVGDAYAEIERLEPWLVGAVPAVEAAIVVDGLPLMHLSPMDVFPAELGASVAGLAQLLTERDVQFDVVDAAEDFERYRLVVLPDALDVDTALAARLNAYLADGGAVIASHRAMRLAGGELLWPDALGGARAEASPFPQPFARVAGELLGSAERYAEYDFLLHAGADRWQLGDEEGVTVHARLTEPAFARAQTSFQNPPPDRLTAYAAVVETGGLGAFAFPLGASYHDHGYWIHRELFARLLDRLLPEPLVRTSAPASAEVAVAHQAAAADRGERWIVHVVNWSPLRRGPSRIEYLEDPIPLHDVQLALAVATPIARAYEARTGAELALERHADRWHVSVPVVPIAATVVFEAHQSRPKEQGPA